MKEIWKDIQDYEGLYKVSNSGKVIRNTKELKQNTNKGYKYVNLCKKCYSKPFYIHRLVAQAFIPNPNNYNEINHIDGNKINNSVSNLEWCSHKQNMDHARKTLLISKKGVNKSIKSMNNKTKKPILQIKDNVVVGCYESLADAQRKTNIKSPHICNVLKGKRKSAGGFCWEYKKVLI